MRERFHKTLLNDQSTDPLVETIDALSAKPRMWKERIETLSYEAATVEERIDDEFTALQDQWQEQSASQMAHQERLAELRTTLDTLQLESDELQLALDQTRNALARQSEEQQQLRKAAEHRMRTMAHKIPKLQQQISMYAMCTGIKWDYDNPTAWTGHVVSSFVSIQSYILSYIMIRVAFFWRIFVLVLNYSSYMYL